MTRRLRPPRRRNAGWLVIVALVLLVSGVAGVPYLVAGEDARRPAAAPNLVKLHLPAGLSPHDLESARVEEVIDGDTLDVTLDGKRARVRYFGVDTPERGSRCFREAEDRNESLVGGRVFLLKDAREEDRFGRYLRYVFLADGVSVDATLVAEGFGRAWRDDGRYRDEIVAIEAQAQAAGRGCLWK